MHVAMVLNAVVLTATSLDIVVVCTDDWTTGCPPLTLLTHAAFRCSSAYGYQEQMLGNASETNGFRILFTRQL